MNGFTINKTLRKLKKNPYTAMKIDDFVKLWISSPLAREILGNYI